MIKTIREVIEEKGSIIYDINYDATVYQALEVLAEHNIGALVVKKDDAIIGIFSERDFARKVALRDRTPKTTSVEAIMTTSICYISPEKTVEEGLAIMTERRCRHLPVYENGIMIAFVSIGDLVKAQVEEKEFIINQLENYIRGG